MAGLTEFGFEKPALLEIKAEIEEKLRLKLGEGINLLPEDVLGNLVGVFAERESLIWDAMEEVYDSQYPDTAYGASLSNVVRLTGTDRRGAQKSRVTAQIFFGDAGTPIPAGTIISVNGNPDATFKTDAGLVLGAGADEVQSLAFSAVPTAGVFRLRYRSQDTASIPYNAAAGDIQAALNALANLSGVVVAGTFAAGFTITFSGDDGKQAQSLLEVPLTSLVATATPVIATVARTTAGVPQASGTLTAENSGVIAAPAGQLSVIETPVTGLTRSFNLAAADLGAAVESDSSLRLRRETELQNAGSSTVRKKRNAPIPLVVDHEAGLGKQLKNQDQGFRITVRNIYQNARANPQAVGLIG